MLSVGNFFFACNLIASIIKKLMLDNTYGSTFYFFKSKLRKS